MKFCTNCGNELDDNAVVCPACGVPAENTTSNSNEVDKGGFLWGLLGCCIPVAGLVLFLIWRDNKPKTAKVTGIGAIVGTVASIAIVVLYFVFIVFLGISYSNSLYY